MTETRIADTPLETYLELFCHRRDVFAQQTRSGSYFLRHEPVTTDVVRAHLTGKLTAGWYGPAQDGTTRWIVLDADQADGLEQLQAAWQQLHDVGLPSYLESSRRGGHLWIFFEPDVTTRAARQLVLGHLPDLPDIEVFPKRDRLDHGVRFGNLVRGPLGIHHLSRRRYPFIDPISGVPVARDVRSTLDWLASAEQVSTVETANGLAELMALAPGSCSHAYVESSLAPVEHQASWRGMSAIQRLKAAIGDPYVFISQFVELDERGRGHCPFHPPDRHPSFAVNRKGGYWVCFHRVNPATGRYLGGDALEFYRHFKGLSYQDMLEELQADFGA